MAELPPDTTRPTEKVSIKGQRYTIQRGDTWGSVAERFGLTTKFLARMNRMPANTSPTVEIEAGTVLTIPRVEFDPLGPIAGAWAQSDGWMQNWSQNWSDSNTMWVQKGKFVEIGDEVTLPLLGLPGGKSVP